LEKKTISGCSARLRKGATHCIGLVYVLTRVEYVHRSSLASRPSSLSFLIFRFLSFVILSSRLLCRLNLLSLVFFQIVHFHIHIVSLVFSFILTLSSTSACSQKASREQPNNETALKELASAYIQTGKLSEALTTFDRLLQINPKNSFALTGKGIIYYLMEKYAEATIQFTAVLQNEPDNTDVLVKRASCYLNVANIEKAFTDSQRALQIDVSPYRHFSLTFFSFPSVAFLQQIHILHSDLDVICDCVFVRLFV